MCLHGYAYRQFLDQLWAGQSQLVSPTHCLTWFSLWTSRLYLWCYDSDTVTGNV